MVHSRKHIVIFSRMHFVTFVCVYNMHQDTKSSRLIAVCKRTFSIARSIGHPASYSTHSDIVRYLPLLSCVLKRFLACIHEKFRIIALIKRGGKSVEAQIAVAEVQLQSFDPISKTCDALAKLNSAILGCVAHTDTCDTNRLHKLAYSRG